MTLTSSLTAHLHGAEDRGELRVDGSKAPEVVANTAREPVL